MEDQTQDQNQNPDQNSDTNGSAPAKGEKTVPYARFAQINDAKKAAEEVLAGIVDELTEDVPEAMRDIIPDLAPAEKIKWLRNATKKGLFSAKPDTSGPDSKRPGGKPNTDTAGMSPTQLIEFGLKA